MQFEIVAFYPKNTHQTVIHKDFIGTVHVFMPQAGFDVRGILVFKKPKKFTFETPKRWTVDEKGKKVSYPVFAFRDKDIYGSLVSFLKEEFAKTFTLE